MNHDHAREAVQSIAMQYLGKSYDELCKFIGLEHECHRVELHGVTYQVTFDAFWDDKPGGLLRLWFAVDDCGVRAFFPMVLCDLIAPSQVFNGALE